MPTLRQSLLVSEIDTKYKEMLTVISVPLLPV